MNRFDRDQRRAQREFRQLQAKTLEERHGESVFKSLPLNDDGTRSVTGLHHSIEDLNDLMIPMNTRNKTRS